MTTETRKTLTKALEDGLRENGWTDEEIAKGWKVERHYKGFQVMPDWYVADKGRWSQMLVGLHEIFAQGTVVRDEEGGEGELRDRYLRVNGKEIEVFDMLFTASYRGRMSDDLYVA